MIVRLKEDYDGAEPAPSSVAALNLMRLDWMLGGGGYRERGMRTIEASRNMWLEHPHGLPQMLLAVEAALEAPRTVVIAGDPSSPAFRALAAVIHESLGPRRAILAADGADAQRWLATKRPYLAEMRPIDGAATAYVCEDYTCRAPVKAPEELRAALRP